MSDFIYASFVGTGNLTAYTPEIGGTLTTPNTANAIGGYMGTPYGTPTPRVGKEATVRVTSGSWQLVNSNGTPGSINQWGDNMVLYSAASPAGPNYFTELTVLLPATVNVQSEFYLAVRGIRGVGGEADYFDSVGVHFFIGDYAGVRTIEGYPDYYDDLTGTVRPTFTNGSGFPDINVDGRTSLAMRVEVEGNTLRTFVDSVLVHTSTMSGTTSYDGAGHPMWQFRFYGLGATYSNVAVESIRAGDSFSTDFFYCLFPGTGNFGNATFITGSKTLVQRYDGFMSASFGCITNGEFKLDGTGGMGLNDATATDDRAMIRTNDPPVPNYFLEMLVGPFNDPGGALLEGDMWCRGIAAASDANALNGYGGYFYCEGGGVGVEWEFNGPWNQTEYGPPNPVVTRMFGATRNFGEVVGAGSTVLFRLEAEGNTFRGFVNGELVWTDVDSANAFPLAGFASFAMRQFGYHNATTNVTQPPIRSLRGGTEFIDIPEPPVPGNFWRDFDHTTEVDT